MFKPIKLELGDIKKLIGIVYYPLAISILTYFLMFGHISTLQNGIYAAHGDYAISYPFHKQCYFYQFVYDITSDSFSPNIYKTYYLFIPCFLSWVITVLTYDELLATKISTEIYIFLMIFAFYFFNNMAFIKFYTIFVCTKHTQRISVFNKSLLFTSILFIFSIFNPFILFRIQHHILYMLTLALAIYLPLIILEYIKHGKHLTLFIIILLFGLLLSNPHSIVWFVYYIITLVPVYIIVNRRGLIINKILIIRMLHPFSIILIWLLPFLMVITFSSFIPQPLYGTFSFEVYNSLNYNFKELSNILTSRTYPAFIPDIEYYLKPTVIDVIAILEWIVFGFSLLLMPLYRDRTNRKMLLSLICIPVFSYLWLYLWYGIFADTTYFISVSNILWLLREGDKFMFLPKFFVYLIIVENITFVIFKKLTGTMR